MGKFTKDTTLTLASRILTLLFGFLTSVIITRTLGPEKRGVYFMALFLPDLITIFSSLGIGFATTYNIARKNYKKQEVFGNNIILSLLISIISVSIGLIIIFFFHDSIVPGIDQKYLLIAIIFIPQKILFTYLQSILLGGQKFKEYNMIGIIQIIMFLIFVVISLNIIKAGIIGALLSGILSWSLTSILLFLWLINFAGGISFRPNIAYLKKTLTYGLKTHLGNILMFLHLRVDILFINKFLNPTAVGFYSVGVTLVEKLALLSQSAAIVLFPKIAGEQDEKKRKDFTPMITRNVFFVTLLCSLIMLLLSRYAIIFLFSSDFIPSIRPLQILLIGTVALSAARVIGNDIAARNRPILNTYISIGTLAVNITLNLIWIPRYGIEGAAWASTLSYTLTLLARIYIYCYLSKNSWTNVIIPNRNDLPLYHKLWLNIISRNKYKRKGKIL